MDRCFTIAFFPVVLLLGFYVRGVATKYKIIFLKIGLKNNLGETPKIISRKKLDNFRTKYIFDNSCVDLSKFEEKRGEIEVSFRQNIESIKYGKHKGRTEIVLNKQDFPERVTYSKLFSSTPLPRDSFFIGYSAGGILTQSIAELPHLLIAGTTGSGKSVFLKQVLMGLLESTPHIQMYLVDLKGGLEMIDFKKSPNVRVVKTIEATLKLFQQVDAEMQTRFQMLEEKGKKQIIPKAGGKTRIVLAVDEASVLYMNRAASDPNRESVIEARALADSIAKRSRASAIHLILATQKVENRSIPTYVTENLSGRMVFRVNSLQASNQVIGSKDAMILPEIPGRGIWTFGIKKVVVQAPFIDGVTIKKRCKKMSKVDEDTSNSMLGKGEEKKNEQSSANAEFMCKESEDEIKGKDESTEDS